MGKPVRGTRSIPKGAPRELLEEGSHQAVCVGCIHVGTQPANKEGWDDQNTIYLLFQAVNEETSAGKPFVVAKPFNYVFSSGSNLGKLLDAWLGVEDDEFDITTVVGEKAIITIKHNESKKGTFANITTITAPPKGSEKSIRKATVPFQILMLDEEGWDEEVYESLPDFYKLKIAASDEGVEMLGDKPKGKKGKEKDEEEEEDEKPRSRRSAAKEEKPKRRRG